MDQMVVRKGVLESRLGPRPGFPRVGGLAW